jgi:hypothetical protein
MNNEEKVDKKEEVASLFFGFQWLTIAGIRG